MYRTGKLTDRSSSFSKEYLKLLVSEMRINGNQTVIIGSYSAFAYAVSESNTVTLDKMPRLVPNWLPDKGSNLGPAD